MKFGLALPHYDFSLPNVKKISWETAVDWARRAEEFEFESVWVSDHLFFDTSKYGGTSARQSSLECWSTLAALATATQRVRFGSLVLCNDLRSPVLVAKMAAAVDVFSQGRLEVGMGAGWYEPEYQAAGIPFDPPGLRVSRLEESVQIVRGLLSERSLSFAGKHYQIEEAWNLPGPIQSPPAVFIGGKGDRVTKIAARHADGYNSVWAWTPQSYAGRVRLLDEEARNVGRDPRSISKSVGLYTLGASTDTQLQAAFTRYFENSPKGIGDGVEIEKWSKDKLVGNSQQIIAKLKEFEALGVHRVILGFGLLPFQIADPSQVEWFAREIIQVYEQN